MGQHQQPAAASQPQDHTPAGTCAGGGGIYTRGEGGRAAAAAAAGSSGLFYGRAWQKHMVLVHTSLSGSTPKTPHLGTHSRQEVEEGHRRRRSRSRRIHHLDFSGSFLGFLISCSVPMPPPRISCNNPPGSRPCAGAGRWGGWGGCQSQARLHRSAI